MLTKRELRIGNFIDKSELLGGSLIEKMKYGAPEGYLRVNADLLFAYTEQDPKFLFYGIPLTEEWLKRFGFRYVGTCDALMDGYYAKDNLGWYLDNEFNPVVVGQDSDAIYFGDSLEYVHQLQNLYFALTREELPYASN